MTYALWALPARHTDRLHELVLTVGTKERCDEIEAIAKQDGFHGFRRQLMDGSLPDFAGAVRRIR